MKYIKSKLILLYYILFKTKKLVIINKRYSFEKDYVLLDKYYGIICDFQYLGNDIFLKINEDKKDIFNKEYEKENQ